MSRTSPAAPSWFKLDNYSATSSFDLTEWKQAITIRVVLSEMIASGNLIDFDDYFSQIQKSPLVVSGIHIQQERIPAVLPFEGSEVYVTEEIGISDASIKFELANEETMQTMMEERAHHSSMSRILFVDLHASKTELLADFERLIDEAILQSQAHRPKGRAAGISEAVLRSWHRHQILPYQDLLLWHQREAIKEPSASMWADWLDPYGGGDTRETKTKAKSAFSRYMLRRLSVALPLHIQD